MKEYDCYIFDFDGTLFDTLDSLMQPMRGGLEKIGRRMDDEEGEIYLHASLTDLIKEKNLSEEEIKAFIDYFAKATDFPENLALVKEFEDTKETLKFLHEKNKLIGVASNNLASHMKNVLSLKNCLDYINVLVGTGDYSKAKPDPEPIDVTLNKLNFKDKSKVVYIGDSLIDVEAARNAGVDGYLIDRSNYYPDFKGKKIEKISELINY